MNILAIDGSGNTASIAVLTENEVLAEYSVNYKKTHSQTLLPMIDTVMKMLELEVEKLDYIAVSNGPGSFTGLRICASTAKGLGLALNKPLVGVKTLEGLAYNFEGADCLICPLMDARRNQVYTGIYSFGKDENPLAVIEDQQAVAIEDIVEKVNALGKKVIFLGDGVPVQKKKIEELVKVEHEYAPPQRLLQSAASLGRRALFMINEGKIVSAAELVPEYLRLSQAERERMEKTNRDN